MRILVLTSAFAALLACGPTGPKTGDGPTPCQQLQECICDPDRTSDVEGCNQNIETYKSDPDADSICSGLLRIYSCGNGLQVDTTRISL